MRCGRSASRAGTIAVADSVVGIKLEDQELIFEEFRQVGRDNLKKSGGHGLDSRSRSGWSSCTTEDRVNSTPGKARVHVHPAGEHT